MATYLSLIRRSDFIDLYKYGILYINPLKVVEINCCDNLSENYQFLTSLFANANSFENSFAYVIIKFASDEYSPNEACVKIEDVLNIYPLDQEAKKEFETSFDMHLKIDDPIWEKTYARIQRDRTVVDGNAGIANVWKVFGIKSNVNDCRKVISDSVLQEVVDELYDNRRPSGDLPIWVYLIRYERHSFFPNELVGFFMDVVNVVCNYLSKREVEERDFSTTGIFQKLSSLSLKSKMNDIMDCIENSKECRPFIETISRIENNVDFIQVAVLFLFLKHKYAEGIKYDNELLKLIARIEENNYFKDSFSLSVFLLGFVLGREKTYESLYLSLPLAIYKSSEEMDVVIRQQENEKRVALIEMERNNLKFNNNSVHNGCTTTSGKKLVQSKFSFSFFEKQNNTFFGESLNNNSADRLNNSNQEAGSMQNSLFHVQDVIPNKFPCKMGKLKKGKLNEFSKATKPCVVYNEKEYIAKYNENWRLISE